MLSNQIVLYIPTFACVKRNKSSITKVNIKRHCEYRRCIFKLFGCAAALNFTIGHSRVGAGGVVKCNSLRNYGHEFKNATGLKNVTLTKVCNSQYMSEK